MQLSTRFVIDRIVKQGDTPAALYGPIALESMTAGTATDWKAIVKSAYTPGPGIGRPNRTMPQQAAVFWSLVRKFVVPTCAEVRGWMLYLMRVCVCMEELHSVTNSVMRHSSAFGQALHNMGKDIVLNWAGQFNMEEDYTAALGNGKDYQGAIDYVMRVLNSSSSKHVNLRLVRQDNALRLLLRHVRDTFRQLYDAHQAKHIDAIKIETSRAYEECFLRDGHRVEGDSLRWFRRPGLINYSISWDEKEHNVSREDVQEYKDFIDLGDTEEERELTIEGVQYVLFYSGVSPPGSRQTLPKAVDAFVGALADGVGAQQTEKALTFHRDF